MEKVAGPLRLARWKEDLSQQYVADLMMVSRVRVSQMEKLDPSGMLVRTLSAYAKALGGRLTVSILHEDGTATPLYVDKTS